MIRTRPSGSSRARRPRRSAPPTGPSFARITPIGTGTTPNGPCDASRPDRDDHGRLPHAERRQGAGTFPALTGPPEARSRVTTARPRRGALHGGESVRRRRHRACAGPPGLRLSAACTQRVPGAFPTAGARTLDGTHAVVSTRLDAGLTEGMTPPAWRTTKRRHGHTAVDDVQRRGPRPTPHEHIAGRPHTACPS